MDRLRRDHRIQDLELGVADRLVAERALPATPLETLNDALAASVQAVLVHLRFFVLFVACVRGSDGRREQRSAGQLSPWIVWKLMAERPLFGDSESTCKDSSFSSNSRGGKIRTCAM